MGDTLEFNEIYQEVKGSWNDGRLRFSKQNVVYKSNKTGKVDSIPAGELNLAQWRRVCLGHGIKLGTSTGHVYKYDGFRDTVSYPRAHLGVVAIGYFYCGIGFFFFFQSLNLFLLFLGRVSAFSM
uniref:FACT complex subunit SSRP1/POB3 N-terminal PH domain-containing protein n=1 Tax=Oryzias sinensis TaxID=183150 RepID=A0A8C7X6A7_9TELE